MAKRTAKQPDPIAWLRQACSSISLRVYEKKYILAYQLCRDLLAKLKPLAMAEHEKSKAKGKK